MEYIFKDTYTKIVMHPKTLFSHITHMNKYFYYICSYLLTHLTIKQSHGK